MVKIKQKKYFYILSCERQDGGCSVGYYKRMKDDVGDIWEFSYLTGTQHRGRRCRLLLNAYQAFSAHIVLGWWSFQEPLLRIFKGEIEEGPSILLILQIRTDFQRERPNSLLVAHTNSSVWNFSTNSEEKKQKEVGCKLLAWIKTRLWDCPQCSLKCKAGKMAGGADLPELMHLGTLASLGLWDSGRASIQAEVCFENFRLGLIWGQCFDP